MVPLVNEFDKVVGQLELELRNFKFVFRFEKRHVRHALPSVDHEEDGLKAGFHEKFELFFEPISAVVLGLLLLGGVVLLSFLLHSQGIKESRVFCI